MGYERKTGTHDLRQEEEEIFLGRDFTQKVDYSENTAIEIDAEVRRIIQESYHRAKDLLKTNLRLLHKVAEMLLEKRSWTARRSMPSLESLAGTVETRLPLRPPRPLHKFIC